MYEIAVFAKCQGKRNSPSGLQDMILACIDHHHHHYHVANKELGHLLTHSSLTHPEVSSIVFACIDNVSKIT
jgi:hypothetical protein